jgi:hypothetical protein
MSRTWAIGVAAALSALVLTGAAAAKPQGKWDPVSFGGEQSSVSQIGLNRTPDRVLHVAWQRRTGGSSYDLLHTGIDASGRLRAPTPIVTGWIGILDAALTRYFPAAGSNDDMVVWFSGQRTFDTFDPNAGLMQSSSLDSGATWSAPSVVYRDANARGRTPSATWVRDRGTYLTSWYDIGETVVLRTEVGGGSGPLYRYYPEGSTRCCSYQQNVASINGGRAVVAWCSGIDAPKGIWVQDIDPNTGAPVGAPQRMPGTQDRVCDASGRVPLVYSGGFSDGFYIAEGVGFPSTTQVRLWRVGAASSLLVAAGAGEKRTVAISAFFPDGRIWIGWSRRGSNLLYFRRSNRQATRLGALVTVRHPAGAVEITELDLDSQFDRVDVLARSTPGNGLFHTQVYPGLTLRATGGEVATFRVTDAGDPVAGATVRVAGRRATTNAAGTARIDLPRGSFRATASKANYRSASAGVRTR